MRICLVGQENQDQGTHNAMPYRPFDSEDAGLSLTGGGWGFPPATKNGAPDYFHRKKEEK